MIGSIIGAGAGLATSIFGGISASKQRKKIRKNIEEQRKKNDQWYDRRYNEDATQRADAQQILTNVNEHLKNRNKGLQGMQSVMGGTDEAMAVERGNNADAIAKATSTIAVNGDNRKDNIEGIYLNNDNAYTAQLNGYHQGTANAIAKQTGDAINIIGSTDLSGLDDLFKKNKESK